MRFLDRKFWVRGIVVLLVLAPLAFSLSGEGSELPATDDGAGEEGDAILAAGESDVEPLVVSMPTPNDYDGDGKSDPTVFRKNYPWSGATTWFVRTSTGNAPPGGWTAHGSGWYKSWGLTGDVPVAGDYGGDRLAYLAVFRPSNATWYIAYSEGGTITVQWGLPGDIPVPGDGGGGVGDERHDCIVYRPSNDRIYVRYSSGGSDDFPNTATADYQYWHKPLPNFYRQTGHVITANGGDLGTRLFMPAEHGGGSYGARETRFVVGSDYIVPGWFYNGWVKGAWWRPSTGEWYRFDRLYPPFSQWGIPGDLPVSGDFDGDLIVDVAVWRPSDGTWYVNPSSGQAIPGWTLVGAGPGCSRQWGLSGDTPLNQAVK